MRASRPAAEAEVVLAFLRGEVESPRFGGAVRDALDHVGGVGLILHPNLDSTRDNLLRAQALGAARGWRTGRRRARPRRPVAVQPALVEGTRRRHRRAQTTDLWLNPNGFALLHRDIEHMCTWFTRKGLACDPDEVLARVLP